MEMRATTFFFVLNITCIQAFSLNSCQGIKHAFTVNNDEISRRNSIQKMITSVITTSTLVNIVSTPVYAKDTKEPTTPQALSDAFVKVKTELTSSSGGISTLTTMVNNKEWEEVKEFTKNYDLEFRKAKMGFARKLIPKDDNKNNKQLRADATQMCNNVTFDLIGINKASRVGDFDSAIKYLGELKVDIEEFLGLEAKVVWE